MYTPVRYMTCPWTGELTLHVLCTWGPKLAKLGYHDSWEAGGAHLKYRMGQSVMRPVVRPVLEEVTYR